MKSTDTLGQRIRRAHAPQTAASGGHERGLNRIYECKNSAAMPHCHLVDAILPPIERSGSALSASFKRESKQDIKWNAVLDRSSSALSCLCLYGFHEAASLREALELIDSFFVPSCDDVSISKRAHTLAVLEKTEKALRRKTYTFSRTPSRRSSIFFLLARAVYGLREALTEHIAYFSAQREKNLLVLRNKITEALLSVLCAESEIQHPKKMQAHPA